MKKLFLLLAALITSLAVMAQNQTVSGTVTSADGEPLVGATVMGVGTQIGTATDVDGNFSLSLPSTVKKLQVSYVGMHTKEVAVTPGSKMNIVLDGTNMLDEVITVAYGTAKRSAFTGSASVLDASQIEAVQVTNPIDALKGKVSGVQLNTASGQPGSSPNIFIRGISSISAGTEPLIVVDGTPYAGSVDNISAQDVESMTVLKDAASAALYGARGANGVILITTKRGKGTAKVTFDAKWGQNSRAVKDYDVISSPAAYYEMYGRALGNFIMDPASQNGTVYDAETALRLVNSNMVNPDPNNTFSLIYNVYNVPAGEGLLVDGYKLNPNATLGNKVTYDGVEYLLRPDSWVDAAYRDALRQEYNLSVSQATDKHSFYVSANYLNNEGITANTGYERFTGRLSADLQAKPWLKVGANMSYSHYTQKSLGDDGSSGSVGNIFAVANQLAPIYPLYVRDGNGNPMYNQYGVKLYDYGDGMNAGLERPYFANSNPISDNILNVDKNEGNAMTATGFAEIRFLRDFKFTSNNTVNVFEQRATDVTNPYFGQYATSNGIVQKVHARRIDYTYQQLLNWTRQFGEHNINVLLGHENYWNKYYYLSASRSNMLMPDNTELDGAVVDGSSSSYVNNYNSEGWFGRVNYDYDSKYFGSVSYRRDASSRFDPKHRWGNFWSLSAAWIINKEQWFQAPWVNMLKIKASYGEQGNDNIGNFRYMNMYTIANSGGKPVALPATMGNPNISWEKGGNFNAGVDFSLFNERLNGTIEGFYRKTSDMLFFFPLSPSFGYTGYYDNIGDMANKGFEIDLNGVIFRNRDITWSANLNFTWYKNEITRLPEERRTMTVDGKKGFSSGNFYFAEGSSIYTYHTKKYAGVDSETGQSLWYVNKTDANGVVTRETTTDYGQASYYLCDTALPSAYGGFGTSVEAYGFDFSISFGYQLGGKVLDSTYASLMGSPTGSGLGSAMHKDLYNAWSKENPNSDIPRFQYGDQYSGGTSDRFLTDASYLALQNINFGYTLPSKVTKKIQVDRIRFYLSCDNVALWAKRQGLDPRQSLTFDSTNNFNGESSSAYYSPIRTISGGINVTF
ncbi:TonB-dependent receptor [uncultured Duncaniella sp.]|uniref:SusC/RagA family TonB-linked outer membrane protein n=8 Tax=uncultured Duncaniella sp. TaxID=2768039 RepID=UPI0025F9734E|nr:TonB-dependent receptor [uncultured Duncaniella sp.]